MKLKKKVKPFQFKILIQKCEIQTLYTWPVKKVIFQTSKLIKKMQIQWCIVTSRVIFYFSSICVNKCHYCSVHWCHSTIIYQNLINFANNNYQIQCSKAQFKHYWLPFNSAFTLNKWRNVEISKCIVIFLTLTLLQLRVEWTLWKPQMPLPRRAKEKVSCFKELNQ